MGSAERELLRTGLRYALGLRFVVVAVASLASLALDTTASPALTASLVVGLNLWNLWHAYRFVRRPGPLLMVADVLVVAAICLTQAWTVAPSTNTSSTDWVIVTSAIVVVTYPWQLGLAAHASATLVLMAAYLAGSALADPVNWLAAAPVQLWMVMEAALSRALYVLVRRGARAADDLVARGERLRREAAVAAARRADEREYLASLHDTASATLFMVGAGVVGRSERWFADQAARDLEVIQGESGVAAGDVDLVAMLRDVARHRPLTVRWNVPDALRVPAVEAVALCHGTREALTNVVRHSGVEEATITVRRGGDVVVVEVADEGRGFDPAEPVGDHFGVTRSLVERMARTGGRAEVVGRPGQGVTVRLECPVVAPGTSSADDRIIAAKYLQGLRWAVLAMSLVVLFGLDLPKLIANTDGYEPLWAQFLAFGVFAGVAAVYGVTTWRRRPLGWWRWPLLVLVFAVSVLATESVAPDRRLGIAHWSEGDAAWSAVLLVLDSRIAVFVAVVVAQYAVTFGHVIAAGQSALTVTDAVNATVLVLSYQIAVGMIAAVLRHVARSAARIAREEEDLRTAEAVARQLHQDRKDRYAALGESTRLLLSGLASGELDPGDGGVRRRCAVEAARMRRLFAEDATAADPLLEELRTAVESAERNGVKVQFAERGERPAVPTAVRRALTGPAITALATAAARARVTVVGSGGEVTVSVVADAELPQLPAVAERDVTTSVLVDGDRVWVKATWRGGA